MARHIRKARFAQFALLAFAAGELSTLAAEVLVLRSDGPRAKRHYPAGGRHADDAVFDLRPGETVTVLARGGTRSWRGPGFFSLVQPARPLVLNGRAVRVQTGVVRRVPPAPGVAPLDIREFDIGRDGTLCVAEGIAPSLWRPRSSTLTRVTITSSDGTDYSFDWPAGETSIAWPSAMPITDGGTYFIASGRGTRAARVTTRLLAAGWDGSTDRIALALMQQGCTAQLDTLIATRIDPTAPLLSATAEAVGRGR